MRSELPTGRPSTPPVDLPGGGKRFTVHRSCNGCGRDLGDASDDELAAAVHGATLPDVRDECGCDREPASTEDDLRSDYRDAFARYLEVMGVLTDLIPPMADDLATHAVRVTASSRIESHARAGVLREAAESQVERPEAALAEMHGVAPPVNVNVNATTQRAEVLREAAQHLRRCAKSWDGGTLGRFPILRHKWRHALRNGVSLAASELDKMAGEAP